MRDIPGYEGLYAVTEDGRAWSHLSNRFLKTHPMKDGYIKVSLNSPKQRYFLMHRLVAITYLPNPENKSEVNHKNRIKADNRLENLEWMTPGENTWHSKINFGTHKGKPEKRVGRFSLDGQFIDEFSSCTVAGRTLGLHISSIRGCAIGKYKQSGGFIWKYLG